MIVKNSLEEEILVRVKRGRYAAEVRCSERCLGHRHCGCGVTTEVGRWVIRCQPSVFSEQSLLLAFHRNPSRVTQELPDLKPPRAPLSRPRAGFHILPLGQDVSVMIDARSSQIIRVPIVYLHEKVPFEGVGNIEERREMSLCASRPLDLRVSF